MSTRASFLALAITTILCVFGLAYSVEPAPAVEPVTTVVQADPAGQILDAIFNMLPPSAQKVIATIWTIATAVGLLATLAAFVLRAVRGEDSRIAWWTDTIGYWASKIGTSARKPRPPVAPEKV